MEDKLIIYGHKDHCLFSMRTSTSYNFDSHVHMCYEFLYILKGHVLYTVEGTEYLLNGGDMIFTAPQELHSFSFPEECTYKRQFLHIYPEFIQDIVQLIPDISNRPPGIGNRIPPTLVVKYKLNDIFAGLEEICQTPSPETDILILGYTIQLFAKIHAILRDEVISKSNLDYSSSVQRIIDYIEEHLTENINLDDMAQFLYMDKSYLGRLFKKHLGMTPKVYINMKRIVRAKKLITQGRQATDIFMDCGFVNYATFYRAFKKYVGYSPEEFKKLHKSDQ